MLKAILATVFGAVVGALAGLDLQTRFHLGMGAWAFSGLSGAIIGFLTFKPAEIVEAFKNALAKLRYLPDHPPAYRRMWRQKAVWTGLSYAGFQLNPFLIYAFMLGMNGRVCLRIVAISLISWIVCFAINLFCYDDLEEDEQGMARSLSKSKRWFFRYGNPVAHLVWVFIGLWYLVCWVPRFLQKTLRVIIGLPLWVAKLFFVAVTAVASHERLVVSISAGVGAIAGFFLAQVGSVAGVLLGGFAGVAVLVVSRSLSARWLEQG